MARLLFLCGLSLHGALSWSVAQETPPTLVRTPGAAPAEFIGMVIPATAGVRVDADRAEHPVEKKPGDRKTFEDTGGDQSVGLGPGASLRWYVKDPPAEPVYLYFLVRTGHQQGYEYVLPAMTYHAELNGEAVPLDPVLEVAAVRTYQSQQGWGHDMSWIRSRERVTLHTGDVLTLGCVEQYAFVTRLLLVTPQADAITRLLGRATWAQESLGDADALLDRIQEVFSHDDVGAACDSGRQILAQVRARLTGLQDDIAAAREQVGSGQTVDLAALVERAAAVTEELESGGRRVCEQLMSPLAAVMTSLRHHVQAAGAAAGPGYHLRQAGYHRSVALTYLGAAEAAAGATDLVGLRRYATYLWRAQEFLKKADDARQQAVETLPTASAPPSELTPATAEPVARDEILLNGEWDMTTAGTPESPAEGDWFKIRVPHGPWFETVGNFMALDRRWPGGQAWAWYRTRFVIPADWTGGRLKLHFEAVFHLCEVYLNGQYCGRHIGGFDAFDVDITAAARPGEMNEMLCFVHDTSVTAVENTLRPGEPSGCSSGPNHYIISDLWGQRFGGIWQDVSVVHLPAVRVEDAFLITSVREGRLTVRTTLRNETAQAVLVRLRQQVLDAGQVALILPEQEVELAAGDTRVVQTGADWSDPRLWGIGGEWGEPTNLYYLRTQLTASDGARLDTHLQRFGFREFWIADGQFWLNGRRLPLQGGGNWYLQEGKAPHGNRWFGLHMIRSDRGMNVNIQRWHRHGDVAQEFFELGDELGMLSEPEGPYWGVSGIPDILGYTDWDDPVWVQNVSEHYRSWARKHHNHPSIVLWSIENETFCNSALPEAMVDRFVAFGRALNEEDPTRPVTFHGIENGGYCSRREDIQIVNLHYPSGAQLSGWKERWGGRPCIVGEFQNYGAWNAMTSPDRAKAAAGVESMCAYIKSWTAFHEQIDLSGAMNFLPYICGLTTTADPALMGPWGDLLPDPTTATPNGPGWREGAVNVSAQVPIPWPSLSGPGIKCERLITGTDNQSLINWFDPDRPEITPNKSYEAFAQYWRKMPSLPQRRVPEVIVRVTRDGEPQPGLPVTVRSMDPSIPSPRGAVTDPAGTAWIVFPQAGRYEILCQGQSLAWEAHWLRTDSAPGYGDVPRLELALPPSARS